MLNNNVNFLVAFIGRGPFWRANASLGFAEVRFEENQEKIPFLFWFLQFYFFLSRSVTIVPSLSISFWVNPSYKTPLFSHSLQHLHMTINMAYLLQWFPTTVHIRMPWFECTSFSSATIDCRCFWDVSYSFVFRVFPLFSFSP